MTTYRRIPHDIGFADSELSSYERVGDRLTVSLIAWNEQPIRLVFQDALAMLELAAWEVADLRESDGQDSPLLRQALERHFDDVPSQHAYRLFEFIDASDKVVLAVVATKVEPE